MSTNATKPVIHNIDVAASNTQYALTIPEGTKKIEMKARDGTAFRFAFVTGQVAASSPTGLVRATVVQDGSYAQDGLDLSGQTLYVAAGSACVIEVITWQ